MYKNGHQYIDIWELVLDGSGRMERLTYFNHYPALKAPNPAVSAGGWYMAFQMARAGGAADAGQGTFIHHLAKAPKAPRYIMVLLR
jgi:hypothetical protein